MTDEGPWNIWRFLAWRERG